MVAVINPGAMSYDAGSKDQIFRCITHLYGLYTLNSDLLDPNAPNWIGQPIVRRGEGVVERCEVSGNYFPSSRMRTDGLGRRVGDIFVTDGIPKIDPWPIQ